MSTVHAEEATTRVEAQASTDHHQYLTFIVAEEQYGVDILDVQEIKGYSAITRLPNMPEYMKGVVSLRGTIVPLVDLRMKFGMGATKTRSYTVIIVMMVNDQIVGFLVDAVLDVLDVAGKDIQPPPALGNQVDRAFMSGIANCDDQSVTLLNIEDMFANHTMAPIITASTDPVEETP